MSMDFPASPTVNDIFTPPGVGYSYIWDGVTWKVYSAGGIPPGQVSHFAMSTPPAGWLECNGALVSRSTYAALFAAISTVFGVGDGTSTFGLPDFRGEFIRSWDHGKGTDSGRTFGSSQTQDTQPHSHPATTTTGADVTHTHTWSDTGTAGSTGSHGHDAVPGYFVGANVTFSMDAVTGPAAGTGSIMFLAGPTITAFATTQNAGAHTHSVPVSGTTSGHSVNHTHNVTVASSTGTETRPRNFALLTCIKT